MAKNKFEWGKEKEEEFINTSKSKEVDDDGYEEGKSKERDLHPLDKRTEREILEEEYPTLFSDTTTSIYGAHELDNQGRPIKDRNPPR